MQLLTAISSTRIGANSLLDLKIDADVLKENAAPEIQTIIDTIAPTIKETLAKPDDDIDAASEASTTWSFTRKLFVPEFYCQQAENSVGGDSAVFVVTLFPLIPLARIDRSALQSVSDTIASNSSAKVIDGLEFLLATMMSDFPAEVLLQRTQILRNVHQCCLRKNVKVASAAIDALILLVRRLWVRVQVLIGRLHIQSDYSALLVSKLGDCRPTGDEPLVDARCSDGNNR